MWTMKKSNEVKVTSTEAVSDNLPNSWDSDPGNPYNWPKGRKYVTTLLLSALSFNTIAASTIVAPALSQISTELYIPSASKTQLVLSVYVLAYAVGNLFWAPLSEFYGRKKVLQIASLWFCIWNLVCGFAPNEATLTTGRLLSGAGAAATLAIGVGTIGEIWKPEQRGRSLAVLSTITVLGPCIGPIIGGLVVDQYVGSWRWAFWATTISNILIQLVAIRFFHESHVRTIQRRRNSDVSYRISVIGKVLLTCMKRPFYLMFTQPVSIGMVIYAGVYFGTLYFIMALIPKAFEETYNQSPFLASINYMSFGVGTVFGAQLCAPVLDAIHRRCVQSFTRQVTKDEENGSEKCPRFETPPELRLYTFIPAIMVTIFGLVIIGWSLQYRQHWMVPNLGVALFGFGSQIMTQSSNAYMIDSFNKIDSGQKSAQPTLNWSASAMASIWAAKSLGGFAFPLFSTYIVETMGWGWSFSMLALINFVVGVPVAIMLLVAGESLRSRSRKRIEADMKAGRW